jgi:hypothetical protein
MTMTNIQSQPEPRKPSDALLETDFDRSWTEQYAATLGEPPAGHYWQWSKRTDGNLTKVLSPWGRVPIITARDGRPIPAFRARLILANELEEPPRPAAEPEIEPPAKPEIEPPPVEPEIEEPSPEAETPVEPEEPPEELRGVRIQRLALDGSIVGIHDAFFPDLKQKLAAVMGIFLHHAGRCGRDPYIVVLVDVTAVEACIEQFRIAPSIDHVAGWIEFDDRRSHARSVQIRRRRVLPIEDKHVVLGVRADTA